MAIEITLRELGGDADRSQQPLRIVLNPVYGCRTAWDAHLLVACTLAASDPAVIEDSAGHKWSFSRRSVELISAAVVAP